MTELYHLLRPKSVTLRNIDLSSLVFLGQNRFMQFYVDIAMSLYFAGEDDNSRRIWKYQILPILSRLKL